MTSDLHHLAAAYALDALDADERAEFEAHYPGCAICSVEVLEYRETASRLTTDRVDPPTHVRGRVLAEVAHTRQIPPRASERVIDLSVWQRSRTNAVLGAVAAVTVLIAGVVGFWLGGSGSADDQDLMALLASGDIVVEPLEGESDATVSVAWSAQSGEIVVLASNLAEPGDDVAYALWMLDANGFTPSLLFTPDDDGTVQAFGELPGDPDGWRITVEPAGGSPRPTGEILYTTQA